MERCPTCGEQRRDGARFCTTCGYRFAADEPAQSPAVQFSAPIVEENQNNADPVIAGWPAPPAQDIASPWAPPPSTSGDWPVPPVDTSPASEPPDVTWAEVAATALGRTANHAPRVDLAVALEAAYDAEGEFEAIDEVSVDADETDEGNEERLRQRARVLLDELVTVVDGLAGAPGIARDDLVSGLEIALTQPPALEGDALAELRQAAESAQDRPRDLDTLTALTARAGTIVALIVGYERATAGIERALESIRAGHDDVER